MAPLGMQGSIDDISASITARWTPIPRNLGYRVAVFMTAILMVCLPVIYAGVVFAIGWAVWWHLSHNSGVMTVTHGGRAAIFSFLLYILPAVVGGCMVLFMFKPLFAPRPRASGAFSLQPHEEPRLHAFVEMVCSLIGAPPPRRIDVSCDVNASASFRAGVLSLFRRGDVVLTVGMPLVAGMNTRQFSGVLAHEFGHFAQGGGMRASYLVRSSLRWLARAAYERDGWDATLYAYSHSDNATEKIFAGFMRLGVWLTRLLLKALFWIAHLLAGYMSRQMEFDADRYEVRFAGSEEFEGTFRRLMELHAAESAAETEVVSLWKTKKLPDNLPALIDDAAGRLPAETRDRINKHLADTAGRLFDSHPTTAARVARAKELAEPGIFRLEVPARTLFSDFAGACKKASYGHFRERMGGLFFEATFAATDAVLAPRQKDTVRRKGATGFLGFEPPLTRPFFPPLSKVEAPDDPRAVLERLAKARASVEAGAAGAAQSAAKFRATSEKILRLEQAAELFEAGVEKLPKEMELDRLGRRGIAQAVATANSEAADAAGVMDDVLEAAGVRLASALRLLWVKGVETKVEEVEARRKRAAELLKALRTLRDLYPQVDGLRHDLARAGALLHALESPKTEKAGLKRIKEFAEQVRGRLDEVSRAAGGTPCPYPDEGASNLGERLVGEHRRDDLNQIMGAASDCVDRFRDEHARALAELLEIAAAVEAPLRRTKPAAAKGA